MASIGTNYDPASTAQALAQAHTASLQQMLERQRTQASATEKALGTLGSALSAFQTSLASLAGVDKTMAASSAVFSDPAVASATASSTAAAGTYSFFVAQLASAHQVSYKGLTDFAGTKEDGSPAALTVKVGGTGFSIDLGARGTWTVRDLAAAINGAPDNSGVLASVISGTDELGQPFSELVLTSKQTGAASKIELVPDLGGSDAETSLRNPFLLAPAHDAIVHIGSAGGTPTYSATNTFNLVKGVTMTVSKAQASGSAPLTLTVGADSTKTAANVQAFVDAYNKLKSTVDSLVSPGDPSSGAAAGAFASDSGVRALRDRLVSLVRDTGATSLAGYGIVANRQGTLGLDRERLTKALAANPTGLDTLIGTASDSAPTGIAGRLQTHLKVWTSSTDGQIGSRKEAVSKLQMNLTNRQTVLDRQYDSAYTRYLAQFTQLQALQSSMSSNTSLFDALFSSKKD